MARRQATYSMIATILLVSVPAARSSAQAKGAFVKRPTINVKAMRALKSRFHNGDYREVSQLAYKLLWEDIYQPEVLRYLGASLKEIGKPDAAAAVMHILLRVLEDPRCSDYAQAVAARRWCDSQLKRLDTDFRKQQEQHSAATPTRAFTKPEAVDDAWMTEVTADLQSLHGLYAWTLVGGRKDADKKWIHNRLGQLHRNGAKYLSEVEGRRGVLFAIPLKESHRLSRLVVRKAGPAPFLRVGTRAYGFPFVLDVVIEGTSVATQTIGTDAWEDLKIPLDEYADKDVEIVLKLVVPEDQKWHEGAYFDYVDSFQN